MLEILFGSELETLRTFSTVLDEISIGADRRCTLQLTDDGVAPLHCRLRRDDKGWIASPEAPIWINGVEVVSPTYVGHADRISIGPIVLTLKPATREPSEQALIEGARDDLAGREVYADWLEERGQWDRAEFLRLTVAAAALGPGDPRFAETTVRIQKLARCLAPAWRMQVASGEVEGCKELRREFTCNMTWDRLEHTDDPFVRSCGACKSQVHYCRNEAEAEQHARKSHCIVLDLGIDPRHVRLTASRAAVADVQQPAFPVVAPGMYMPSSFVGQPQRACPHCQGTVPAGFRFCPQCGTPS